MIESEFDRLKAARSTALVPYVAPQPPATRSRGMHGALELRVTPSHIGLIAALVAIGASLFGNAQSGRGRALADGATPIAADIVDHASVRASLRLAYAEALLARIAALSAQSTGPKKTETRAALEQLARRIATEEGVDADLFHRLVLAESNYRVDAVSPKGAMSLAQLMPDTARDLGLGPKDFFEPEANLRGGARYLKTRLDETGSVPLALAAYNAGATRVAGKSVEAWPAETRRYVARITGDPQYALGLPANDPRPSRTDGGSVVTLLAANPAGRLVGAIGGGSFAPAAAKIATPSASQPNTSSLSPSDEAVGGTPDAAPDSSSELTQATSAPASSNTPATAETLAKEPRHDQGA